MQTLKFLKNTFRYFQGISPVLLKFNFNNFVVSALRNIGISAHIDSGKTTFSERLLFYSGKIKEIHEVKGTDKVGATMDFMELEREKGITIQSAATHIIWKDHQFNIIDTPGHVDFTIEVERALRVLDGAILLICGVAGVQPQTLTVDKQMKRYQIPRLIFINKLDRMGANPQAAIQGVRKRLGIRAAPLQVPIGLDNELKGIIDIIKQKAYYFEGKSGEMLKETDIPEQYKKQVQDARTELFETLGEIDDNIAEQYLNYADDPTNPKKQIPIDLIKKTIRKYTISREFVPIFMGSALKNKGVQLIMDGVAEYLPNPTEVKNFGYIQDKNKDDEEKKIEFLIDDKKPFVGYAFKLDENRYGQLTYIRVYQGKLRKGDLVYNTEQRKQIKISRMVKMHASVMEDIDQVNSGDIFAIFGAECNTGDTLTEGDQTFQARCSSMHVPDPVISLSIKPKDKGYSKQFNKALNKFTKEDPTFRVAIDKESEEIIISGMGELHLQIYAERMRREFGVDVILGKPTVNYRECINQTTKFDYLHKKQTGGAGQYARVIGYIEPLPEDDSGKVSNEFVSKIVGNLIPNEFVQAVEKGFYDIIKKGPQTGYPVVNVRYVLESGATHIVDSSSNAFMAATKNSFLQAFNRADPQILEPVMQVEVTCPNNAYSQVMGSITKRKGAIMNTETRGDMFIMTAMVPLSQMFGFSTELRGMTSGLGEFNMEYKRHQAVYPNEAEFIRQKFKIMKENNE